jgi:hypothetical protein
LKSDSDSEFCHFIFLGVIFKLLQLLLHISCRYTERVIEYEEKIWGAEGREGKEGVEFLK